MTPLFDFRSYFGFTYRFLTAGRWSLRRTAINLAFLFVFPLVELKIWTGLLLDEVLYRGYRREPVDEPVFIVGNPRSGTTFLHRVMARDTDTFCTMRMWEVLLSPSIVQRKLTRAVASVDRWFGSPLRRRLDRMERGWHEDAPMHEISFRQPEEDDYLLLHAFSALTSGLSSGLLEDARPYTHFDHRIPRTRRRRLMAFYRRCVQRHLHAERQDEDWRRHYLAKNPALSPKLDTVFEQFPDARVVYLVRSPLEMVPSYVKMIKFGWDVLGVATDDSALGDYILEMAGHWYRYPPERLEREPPDRRIIVRYEDLVADPEGTVRTIYERLGLELRPDFDEVLRHEGRRARGYRSRYRYSFDEVGLSRERIVGELRDVFDRFGFDTGESEPPDVPEATRSSSADESDGLRPPATR